MKFLVVIPFAMRLPGQRISFPKGKLFDSADFPTCDFTGVQMANQVLPLEKPAEVIPPEPTPEVTEEKKE